MDDETYRLIQRHRRVEEANQAFWEQASPEALEDVQEMIDAIEDQDLGGEGAALQPQALAPGDLQYLYRREPVITTLTRGQAKRLAGLDPGEVES